jgi:hypothetical protein
VSNAAEKLRELIAKATPGPWSIDEFPSRDGHRMGWVRSIVDGYEGEMRLADAALIVAAVQVMPALAEWVGAVEALRRCPDGSAADAAFGRMTAARDALLAAVAEAVREKP